MKTLQLACCLLAWSLAGGQLLAANVDWRFPVGLSYADGIYDVEDAIEENPFVTVDTVLPVGLSFQPYVEFTDIGLGLGASVGPAMLIVGDFTSYCVPMGADVRYTLFRKSNVSPYVRGGFRYSAAGGDFLSSGDPGFYAGGGIEFLRTKSVSFAIEAGYDTSEIKVDTGSGSRHVKPVGFTVGLFAVF